MNRIGSLRRIIFAIAVTLLASSAFVFLYCRFAWHPHSTDYFKQFEEGLPWIHRGITFAAFGFLLALFGRRYARVAAALAGLLLGGFWFLVAGASL